MPESAIMKGKTRELPCTAADCDELVTVSLYAVPKFVKCPAHKSTRAQVERRRPDVRDPFEAGLLMEERQQRIVGAVITLRRKEGTVEWEEIMTATGIQEFDEESGVIHAWAVGGQSLPKFDPHRECGQNRVFHRDEVVGVR